MKKLHIRGDFGGKASFFRIRKLHFWNCVSVFVGGRQEDGGDKSASSKIKEATKSDSQVCVQRLNPTENPKKGAWEKRGQVIFLSTSWIFYDLFSVLFYTKISNQSLSLRAETSPKPCKTAEIREKRVDFWGFGGYKPPYFEPKIIFWLLWTRWQIIES